MLKKLINLIIVLILLSSCFLSWSNIKIEAKTINDLKAELNELEAKDKANKKQITNTEQRITQTRNEIGQINIDIENINDEIIQKTAEIKELDQNIIEKDQEIKATINNLQLSSGNSIYLEFIFEAVSITDFIYRMSVSEQLTKHNNDLINEMNDMIEANENRKIELKKHKEDLKQKEINLKAKINSLDKEKNNLYEFERSIADEIKTARGVIDMYEKAGCGANEDINVCANRLLPPDTRFWRPMVQGYVTSEYGDRIHPIYGTKKFHSGIDLSNSDKYNTKIYAVANGKVVVIGYTSSMGNYITIHHNINGKKYTSQYLHLKTGTIKVKKGDLVTKDTVLAIMGSTGNSTGPHLHLSIATGLYYKDYSTYAAFVDHLVNPRAVVNFPSNKSTYWYNRINKYN
jgi:murein DD-endopeptidase MepM/ murein hydrolase activator NlpD